MHTPAPSPCQDQIHATSLAIARIWLTPYLPLSADIICPSPLAVNVLRGKINYGLRVFSPFVFFGILCYNDLKNGAPFAAAWPKIFEPAGISLAAATIVLIKTRIIDYCNRFRLKESSLLARQTS